MDLGLMQNIRYHFRKYLSHKKLSAITLYNMNKAWFLLKQEKFRINLWPFGWLLFFLCVPNEKGFYGFSFDNIKIDVND